MEENKLKLIKLFLSIYLKNRTDLEITVTELTNHEINKFKKEYPFTLPIKYRIILTISLKPEDGLLSLINKPVRLDTLKDKLCKMFNLNKKEVSIYNNFNHHKSLKIH
jgi:hypothetical protein